MKSFTVRYIVNDKVPVSPVKEVLVNASNEEEAAQKALEHARAYGEPNAAWAPDLGTIELPENWPN